MKSKWKESRECRRRVNVSLRSSMKVPQRDRVIITTRLTNDTSPVVFAGPLTDSPRPLYSLISPCLFGPYRDHVLAHCLNTVIFKYINKIRLHQSFPTVATCLSVICLDLFVTWLTRILAAVSFPELNCYRTRGITDILERRRKIFRDLRPWWHVELDLPTVQ